MSKLFIGSLVAVLAFGDVCDNECSSSMYPCLDERAGVNSCYAFSDKGGCGAGHFYCPTDSAKDNVHRCGPKGCPAGTCVHIGQYDGTCHNVLSNGECPNGTFKCEDDSTPAPTGSTATPTPATPAPTDATPAPTGSTAAPTPATPAPTNATPSPTDSTASPTSSTPSPTDSTSSPTTSGYCDKVCANAQYPCLDERVGIDLCYHFSNHGGCGAGHRYCPQIPAGNRCGIRGCPQGTCYHVGEFDGTCHPKNAITNQCPNGTTECN
mmetsp:Transcript_102272/g.125090  ORF Transcript_102272/g.125090 Transcript_102272/m.125090 type:complete len:266 (-) Transcript_102272:71-868(-)